MTDTVPVTVHASAEGPVPLCFHVSVRSYREPEGAASKVNTEEDEDASAGFMTSVLPVLSASART